MLQFLKALILLPIAVIVVLLAVANRAPVLVSFDPFSQAQPEISATVPLYAVVFAAVALGIVIGGCGAWLAGRRHRQARRRNSREVHRLQAETERLRANLAATRGPALPSPRASA